jgi:hypothetical protein
MTEAGTIEVLDERTIIEVGVASGSPVMSCMPTLYPTIRLM